MDTAKKITIGRLLSLRECSKKKALKELSLGSQETEKRSLIKSVLNLIKQALLDEKGLDETLKQAEQIIKDGYRHEWYSLELSYASARRKDIARIRRLITYCFNKGWEVVDIDVPYELKLPGVTYRGESFDAIYGKADIVVKSGTSFKAICFKFGEPAYSYAARSELTRPENAPELIMLKLGLEGRYPGVTCALYYLNGKDDRADEFPVYEAKRGKNIIEHDFFGFRGKELLQHFFSVMSLKVNVTCQECDEYSVCKFGKRPITAELEKSSHAGKSVTSNQEYTDKQKQVIFHKEGPMNVFAVPGAGKTFSLVQRMLNLIREGISPNRILFVTFTNKACQEIKERVIKALGTEKQEDLPQICTFNALGYQILKDNPVLVGYRVKLAGNIDRYRLIRRVLIEVPEIKGVSYDGIYLEHGLIKRLDREFSKISEIGEAEWKNLTKWKDPDGVLAAYHRYDALFKEQGYVTYDMQISLCNELFQMYPELAVLYSKIYQYIMVDEFQDVSADNAEMIYKIARNHENIVIVGDDDQSIYGFRGGSNRFMLDFAKEFQNAKTVIMNENFRSCGTILEAAEDVINGNAERMEKNMIPHNMEKAPLPAFYKDFSVGNLVEVVDALLKDGYAPDDIAILGRFNKTLYEVESALEPYYAVCSPKNYLIDDAVFGAIYDLFQLYFKGFSQDMCLYRLLSRICDEPVLNENRVRSESLMDNICRDEEIPMPNINDAAVEEFYKNIDSDGIKGAIKKIFFSMKAIKHADSVKKLVAEITDILFGLEYYQVTDILSDMADERAIATPAELYLMMQDMLLFKDDKRITYAQKNAIHLLTAHDSKGKEFPVVIIHAVEEFGDTEEERRLLYVAMTRAKKELVITETKYQTSVLLRGCTERMAVIGG